MIKILFFGTPEITIKTLEALVKDAEIKIEGIVTQPDRPVGRKKIITASPVKDLAKILSIPVLQPENSKELDKMLINLEVDFFVVFAFGMILSKSLTEKPKYSAINIHASLLPKYRGASPIQESLLNGDKETGISIIKMDEKMDQGPIYFSKNLSIQKEDNLISLSQKLADESAKIICPVIKEIFHNHLKPISQDHSKAIYCHQINREDGEIHWEKKSAEEIYNMIRAYTPWPAVYTIFHGKRLKILKATFEIEEPGNPPGTFFLDKGVLKIAAINGHLIPQELQIEGKQPINVKSFVNGNKILIQ